MMFYLPAKKLTFVSLCSQYKELVLTHLSMSTVLLPLRRAKGLSGTALHCLEAEK